MAKQVVELQVYWRNLKPYELHDCATPDEIVGWLRAGKIILPARAGPPEQITTVTINYAAPFYADSFGDEREDFVSPKVDIIAVVQRPDSAVTVQFQARILKQIKKPGG
jgi:hypothetical protein